MYWTDTQLYDVHTSWQLAVAMQRFDYLNQDQKNCVENLCGTGEGGRPWLCSTQDRSGVLRADLQMERATAIGYIDVGEWSHSFTVVKIVPSVLWSSKKSGIDLTLLKWCNVISACPCWKKEQIKLGIEKAGGYGSWSFQGENS